MVKENVQEVAAIQLTELQQDLVDLQRQSFALSGAIQYIQQKIAKLSKVE